MNILTKLRVGKFISLVQQWYMLITVSSPRLRYGWYADPPHMAKDVNCDILPPRRRELITLTAHSWDNIDLKLDLHSKFYTWNEFHMWNILDNYAGRYCEGRRVLWQKRLEKHTVCVFSCCLYLQYEQWLFAQLRRIICIEYSSGFNLPVVEFILLNSYTKYRCYEPTIDIVVIV